MATTTTLGKVSLTMGGNYSPTAVYDRLTVVRGVNGNSYVTLMDGVSGISPGVTSGWQTYWQLFAEDGSGGGGGSTVTVTQVLTSGTKIATIGVDGTNTDLYAPSQPEVSGKADKVRGAAAGNFAALDSSGNLTDSGHKPSDYLTPQDISGKLDAPETAGTAGQVLKLGSDLQPIWGNGGGGSDLPEGGSAGDVLMKTADGLEWSDDVTELKSAIGGDVTVSGTTPTITAAANTRYLCGEVSTISFTPSATGICDVIFTSGTTAAVLTIPATVKFPAGVDLTSLETNTIYEINVLNGIYGVVATWPLS